MVACPVLRVTLVLSGPWPLVSESLAAINSQTQEWFALKAISARKALHLQANFLALREATALMLTTAGRKTASSVQRADIALEVGRCLQAGAPMDTIAPLAPVVLGLFRALLALTSTSLLKTGLWLVRGPSRTAEFVRSAATAPLLLLNRWPAQQVGSEESQACRLLHRLVPSPAALLAQQAGSVPPLASLIRWSAVWVSTRLRALQHARPVPQTTTAIRQRQRTPRCRLKSARMVTSARLGLQCVLSMSAQHTHAR
jgi:hypothetical protein